MWCPSCKQKIEKEKFRRDLDRFQCPYCAEFYIKRYQNVLEQAHESAG